MSIKDDQLLAELDAMPDPDEDGVQIFPVEGAGGLSLKVLGEDEKEWFESNLRKYQTEYAFENVADLQDLDRLLGLELLSYRWTGYLIQGVDRAGKKVVEKDVRIGKEKIDGEIRLLKAAMGMDRKNRMTAEVESVPDYLKNLLRRAHEFGVHRDHQIAKAIDLLMELKKLVGLQLRVDEEEALMLGVSDRAILQWIREVAIPEFDLIDEQFRKNQRLWIKEVS